MTSSAQGVIRGLPLRFVRGHHGRGKEKYPIVGQVSKSPENKSFQNMKQRCERKECKHYHNYGGRGIKIIGKMRTFRGFLEVLGKRPGPGYSIGRIDNDGHYEEGNIEWQTREEQNRNTRYCKLNQNIADQIRSDKNSGISVKDIATKYGISVSYTSQIARGSHWPPVATQKENYLR